MKQKGGLTSTFFLFIKYFLSAIFQPYYHATYSKPNSTALLNAA